MDTRKAPDGFAIGTMLLLCVIWGIQQVAIKVAAPDIAPTMQIALRSMAGAVLVALAVAADRPPVERGAWRPGLLAGVLFSMEFYFIGEGLRYTTASHMSVFVYTAPIFTALGLHATLPDERLLPMQWTGIAIAFAGIAVAFLSNSADAAVTPAMLWGDTLGLLAGAAWGGTTVLIRCSSLARAPASVTLLYQLACAGVLVLGMAAVSGQTRVVPTPVSMASLAFQIVVVSFFSLLAWFWLLRRYLAARLSIFTFVTPLLGVAFGATLLDEPLSPGFLGGGALVLAGITLVNAAGLLRGLRGRLARRPRP